MDLKEAAVVDHFPRAKHLDGIIQVRQKQRVLYLLYRFRIAQALCVAQIADGLEIAKRVKGQEISPESRADACRGDQPCGVR